MTFQTTYGLAQPIGRVGAISRSARGINADTKIASVPIPFGCLVVRDNDDLKAKLVTSAAEVRLASKGSGGVAAAHHVIVSADYPNDPTKPTWPVGKEFPCLRKGSLFVLVEENVVQGQQAFVRFAPSLNTTDGTQNQLGAFRASPDGAGAVAQVATLTPTAADSTEYSVQITNQSGEIIAEGSFLSGVGATATQIVTGLKAALGTVAGLVFSGTTTLVITAASAGIPFTATSVGAGTIGVAATTANTTGEPSAVLCEGAYFQTTASAGGLAELRVNFGAT